MELIKDSSTHVTYVERVYRLDSGVIVHHVQIIKEDGELIREQIINQHGYQLDSDLESRIVKEIKEYSKNLG